MTHRTDLLDEVVERLVAGVRVELRRLDDEQRRRVVVEKKMMVRLVQFAQVPVVGLQRDRFGIEAAAVHAPQQHVGRRLQVDDEIGRRHVTREQIVQTLIDEQLVIVQVQVREDLVLVEHVIADRRLSEQIGLPQRRLLPMPVEKIEELRLQRRARTIGVEVGEKGIVGLLEHDRRVEVIHPREVFAALKGIRGNNMAKAAVEMAAWDLYARQRGEPLARVLGGTRTKIASGVSIGIQDSLDDLAAKVEQELAAGYRRIKIKIKPGWDVDAVGMIRNRFGSIPLMVDANAAYSLADANHLAKLDRFDLMMIEQPLEYDDPSDTES